MFGLFKSKKKKETLAINAALDILLDKTENEIAHMERQFSDDQKLIAASCIRRAVMSSAREVGAVERLDSVVSELNRAGRIHEAFGTAVGMRLVMAGVCLTQAEGEAWFEASISVASLEGMIIGFMERAGEPPWPVRYGLEVEFERYRLEYLAGKSGLSLLD